MSVRQDRFTFFGVLAAVVIVVLGYLQLGQLYPVAGRDDAVVHDATNNLGDAERRESDKQEADVQP